jgi:hypothetical protein
MECVGFDRACVKIRVVVETRRLGPVTVMVTAKMDLPGFCPFAAGAQGAEAMIAMMRRLM